MTQRPASQVTSSFVHDLRSALATIRVLTKSRKTQPPSELTGAFQMALSRVESLVMGLTDDTPGQSQEPRPVFRTMGEAFQNIQTVQGARARLEFGVQLQAQVSRGASRISPDALPLPVLELVRVIENLCLNAAEASLRAPGRADYVCVLTAKLHGSNLWIEVRDNGPGLPFAIQHNPFIGHSIGKPRGTGLGLRYCKQTIEHAGGTLRYRTAPGRGTTFRINLRLRG